MPFKIIRNDITKMQVDAIVNAAKNSLEGGGGVDGQIHAAAGPGLLAECMTLGGCKTGDAKITGGYGLPARHVIHTVGPVWQGGGYGEEALLRSCYLRSLELAAEHGLETVAFPLISGGIFGYPKAEAMRIAADTIWEFLTDGPDMTVYLVLFGREAFHSGEKLYADIEQYIDDHYADIRETAYSRRSAAENIPAAMSLPLPAQAVPSGAKSPDGAQWSPKKKGDGKKSLLHDIFGRPQKTDSSEKKAASAREETGTILADALPAAESAFSLEELLNMKDESFSEMLLRLIDEKGMTDPECYHRANIDRKHFSKIRSDASYKPKKETALALAIGLRLTLPETRELLLKAGFALSASFKRDVIVQYFIEHGEYDILKINEVLFDYDQPLLGNIA